ncbi:MAG: LSU m3Psi1915 methyltransferase RlmH, partial [uncultured Gemmatimonadetes bacterium]
GGGQGARHPRRRGGGLRDARAPLLRVRGGGGEGGGVPPRGRRGARARRGREAPAGPRPRRRAGRGAARDGEAVDLAAARGVPGRPGGAGEPGRGVPDRRGVRAVGRDPGARAGEAHALRHDAHPRAGAAGAHGAALPRRDDPARRAVSQGAGL